MDMEEIVALSVKHNVSDLHLCSNSPPRWRRLGHLESAPFPAPDVELLLKTWLNDDQQGAWWANGQVDFAVSMCSGQRLRASAFNHIHGVSITLRLLPATCPKLSELTAPKAIPDLLSSDNGLILVTGATGSGKSTTLAAMVDHLNCHSDGHILTLEDPVEFIYQSNRCLIQQREIGLALPILLAGYVRHYVKILTSFCSGNCGTAKRSAWRSRPQKPGIWCWRRCIPEVRLRPSNGWWIHFLPRKKIRYETSWRGVCVRYWRKSLSVTRRAGEWRFSKCW